MLASHVLDSEVRRIVQGGAVLDVGCLGWSLYQRASRMRSDLRHFGCDRIADSSPPPGIVFRVVDLATAPIPFADDQFDLVVASHVIEHLPNPIEFVSELIRVCKPGARLFIEAPSDHACWFSWPFAQDRYLILSFYDDPTHIGRPWTPQALHRIGLYFGCEPVLARYDFSFLSLLLLVPSLIVAAMTRDSDRFVTAWWRATGWACFSVLRKPEVLSGAPAFKYFSFKGAPAGRRSPARGA